jgi:hypothetical protein
LILSAAIVSATAAFCKRAGQRLSPGLTATQTTPGLLQITLERYREGAMSCDHGTLTWSIKSHNLAHRERLPRYVMSEADSTQQPDRTSSVAEPAPPQPDDWDLRVVPMLWFVGTLVVMQGILEAWLPSHLSNGIAFFIAGLVLFRFRGPRWARYGFGKWAAFFLVVSAGAALLHLLLSALPGYLSLGVIVFIGALALFRFRGPRWARYGFMKWAAFWLLISASLSLLYLLMAAMLSKIINR